MKQRASSNRKHANPAPQQVRAWQVSRKRFFHGDPEAGEEYGLPYRGQRIKAVIVDGVGGYYKPGYHFGDALCRSAAGEYFLVREVSRDRIEPHYWQKRRFDLAAGRFWLRVKKLSFRCALQYATSNMDESFLGDIDQAMARKKGHPGRIMVELDDVATAMLREFIAKGHECLRSASGRDPRDLVSAAVIFMLGNPDVDPWNTTADCFEITRARRMAAEGKEEA